MVMELVPKPAKPVSNISHSPITVLKGCVEGHCGGDLNERLDRRPQHRAPARRGGMSWFYQQGLREDSHTLAGADMGGWLRSIRPI